MQLSRAQLKLDAKASLRGVRPHPMLVTLIYLLIPFCVQFVIYLITIGISNLITLASLYLSGNQEAFSLLWTSSMASAGLLASFLSILLSLFSLVLAAGFTFYGMKLARRQEAGFSVLFEGFPDAGRILLAGILQWIFVFLWSLLFVIPGIIAAYRYRMTFRILKDHPEVSALTAITMSKELMQGYKAMLFVQDLSFLGWLILSSLTLGILGLWVSPYMAAADTNFYDALQGRFPRQNADGQAPNVPPVWEQ